MKYNGIMCQNKMTEISAYEYYLYLKGNYLFFQEETETQNLIFTYQ